MFGSGWEKATPCHRFLGTVFLLVIFAHAGCMMAKWLFNPYADPPYSAGGPLTWTSFRQNLFGYAYYQRGAVIWGWALQAMTYFLMFGLSLVSLTAVPPVRRRFYWLFYRVHLLLPLFILGVLAHSWTAWQFAIVGMMLYTLDKVAQAAQALAQLISACRSDVRTVRFETVGRNMVTLTLESPSSPPPQPGQTMYLFVPSISSYWPEFHPFTVVADFATADRGPLHISGSCRWRHYISASGNARWTDRLFGLSQRHLAGTSPLQLGTTSRKRALISPVSASEPAGSTSTAFDGQAGSSACGDYEPGSVEDIEQQASIASTPHPLPRILVLGPFGRPVNAVDKDLAASPPRSVILFAAGSGITPIAALLEAHLHRRRWLSEESQAAPPALRLVWVIRDLALEDEFAPLLEWMVAQEGTSSLSVFYTGGAETIDSPSPSRPWRPTIGRPDVLALLEHACESPAAVLHPAVALDAHCCGPAAFASSVKEACRQRHAVPVCYHNENFEL